MDNSEYNTSEIIHLPQDIFTDGNTSSEKVIFHYYSARVSFKRLKSILHKNAISLVLQGEKKIHFPEKTMDINEQEFHFLSAGNCLVPMEFIKGNVFSSILIFFADDALNEIILKHTHKAKISYNNTPLPYISIRKDDFIRNYISSLQLLIHNQEFSSEMKMLKFEELVLYLLEKYPSTLLSFQMKRYYDDAELKLRNVMETNITNNLSTEELAFLCNVSVSTFKRRFLKIYGTSPSKWLLKRRMEIAANLLQNNNEKPSDVFYKIGYQNHSSFSQSFKQVFGTTPKEYQSQK